MWKRQNELNTHQNFSDCLPVQKSVHENLSIVLLSVSSEKNGITLIIFHHAPFKIINSIVELLRDFNLLLPPTPPPPPSTPAIKVKTF